MTEIGRRTIGLDAVDRAIAVKKRIKRRTELNRDKSRRKMLELRDRYKAKVERNEEKMAKRKTNRAKLGPTCVSLMESRKKAKQRASAIGSMIPPKPKFSEANSHAPRIYGKRFELIGK